METTTTTVLDLLRQMPGDMLHLDEIPLLGFAPAFPWDAVAAQIGKTLQIEGLKLQASPPKWLSKEELFAGLGDDLQILPISVAPLPGKVYWLMSKKDISQMMAELLTDKSPSSTQVDTDFQEAFYRFLAIETLNAIEKSDFDKKLSFSFSNENAAPSEPALSTDISISFREVSAWGRLLINPEFRSAWQKRYLQRPENFYQTSPLAENIQVTVHLEAGRTSLTMSEWKSIHLGDFIILDSCSLEAGEDKGRVMLTVNGFPFFRGRVKQGSIKILEHPLYHEVSTAMNKNPGDDDLDEDFEDEDFETSDFDDTTEESELEESEIEPSEIESESELESEIESDIESDFEEDEEEKKPTAAPAAAPAAPQKPAAPTAHAAQPTSATLKPIEKEAGGKPPSVEDIPLQIVIEVGRLQMSVKKLMELQPGNMLELDIHPESGVDLVVNGRRIAKGELLRIGEALGVRILEIT